MTRDDFLNAINDIPGTYIGNALNSLRPAQPVRKQKRRITRRLIALLVAAILVLLSGFAAAMAASPELRGSVFSFFHLQVRDTTTHLPAEDVPLAVDTPAGSEGSSSPLSVTVTRVREHDHGNCVNGLFRVCTDLVEYAQGSHYAFYTQQDGELEELPLQYLQRTCSRNGRTYRFDLEWATDGKATAIGYFREPEGGAEDALYRLQALPGRPGMMLALLSTDADGLYPMELDLRTGDLTDLAPGLDLEALGGIRANGWSDNGRTADLSLSPSGRFLVFAAPSGIWYAGDTEAGDLYDLNVLTGAALTGCSSAGDEAVACWQLVGGEPNAAQAEAYAAGLDNYHGNIDYGTIRIWRIPTDTWRPEFVAELPATALTNTNALWHGTEREEPIGPGLLSPVPYLAGRWALELGTDLAVYVTDLANGERGRIDGLRWPDAPWPRISCQTSPLGDRILVCQRNEQGQLVKLIVLDLQQRCWIDILRENTVGGNEHWCTWADNDLVLVESEILDSSGRDTGEHWSYLYRIVP